MFERVLKKAVKRLSQAKSKKKLESFGVVGGLAASRWGYPRATLDIDFFISLGERSLKELAESLGGKLRKGGIDDPLLATISFDEEDELGAIPIQLLQFPPSWEEVAMEGMVSETIDGTEIPFVGWKALVLLKLYAGGPIDLEDARNILKVVAPSTAALKDLEKRARSLRVSNWIACLEKVRNAPNSIRRRHE